eukprot:gene12233-16389_t
MGKLSLFSNFKGVNHVGEYITLIRGGSSAKVTEIKSESQFNAILSADPNRLVVVDFHAVWCGPCKMIAPAFIAMAESEQYSTVAFVKVDIDEVESIRDRYEVMSMPTFLFLKNGKPVARFSGASVQKLQETIDSFMIDDLNKNHNIMNDIMNNHNDGNDTNQ